MINEVDARPRTTAIYIRGDRTFLRRMKALAARRGETVSDMVRNAVEKVHGDELRAVDSFFAKDDASTHNSSADATHVQAKQS